MKLLLLHGPAINSSRTRLTALKQEFNDNDVVVFESGASIQEIMGSLMTIPLVSEPRLVVWENPPEDFYFPPLNSYDLTLILWFDHEVSEKKPTMEWVKKNGQILYFPEAREVSVFPFLDYLVTADKKAFLEVEKLIRGGFDIHYLITMVFYLLRNLVSTPKKAPEFVKKKIAKQRARLNLADIKNLYKDILEIDFKIKSGLLEKPQAEFLLVNLFTH